MPFSQHVRATLPASHLAAAEARRRVGKMCRGLSSSMAETAQLLVSELVTNALVHGQGAIGLHISRQDGVLRVEVSAAGEGERPRAKVPCPDEQDGSGRGLFLLAALARSWGSEPASGARGGTVWFELGPPIPPLQSAMSRSGGR